MNKKKVTLNSLTDTGFMFEVGNSMIGFIASFQAGMISLSIASLCILARLSGEFRKENATVAKDGLLSKIFVNGPLGFIGRLVNIMSRNLGASLMISGGALIIASFFAINYGSLEMILTSKEALILALFGIANGLRGVARGFNEQSLGQKLLDTIGIVLAAAGVVMAGAVLDFNNIDFGAFDDGLNLAVKIGFILAAVLAIYQAIRSLPTKGLLQPDLVFALACFGNAVLVHNQFFMMIANILFGIAFIALDALKKKNGLYELYFS